MFESLLAYPVWMLIGLTGLVLGFLGAGLLGAGIIGGGMNLVLSWNSIVTPTVFDPSLPLGQDILSWFFQMLNFPTFNGNELLFAVAWGGMVCVMASYLGNFVRKKLEGGAL